MQANTPRAHRFYLAKANYPLSEKLLVRLSPREEGLLTTYGFWMEALASGRINPVTEEQQQFVMVVRGFRAPQTRFEIAWSKHAALVC